MDILGNNSRFVVCFLKIINLFSFANYHWKSERGSEGAIGRGSEFENDRAMERIKTEGGKLKGPVIWFDAHIYKH